MFSSFARSAKALPARLLEPIAAKAVPIAECCMKLRRDMLLDISTLPVCLRHVLETPRPSVPDGSKGFSAAVPLHAVTWTTAMVSRLAGPGHPDLTAALRILTGMVKFHNGMPDFWQKIRRVHTNSAQGSGRSGWIP